ncbi:MAG: hypothetical protein J6L88_08960 [Clostridia bacterium]|nr:hypothetical protein [Clostridia bacterium]
MQKNLMLERKQKQYIIHSTTVGEANTGIDAGFVRAVHRNLRRMYQLYVFVFARGKRAMSDAQNADYVVKIESGTKRQSEQYALFYALSPVLYAKTVHDAMGLGATAAEYEDYQVEPITVCAAEDMDSLTEKLSGIRCRTQKDFLASMRVFCRAVVSIETPYNMTIDVKNEADMDTVLDYTKDYFLEEEKEEHVTTPAPAAPSYNMFGSDLPAPVGFAGGINKRTETFASSTIGASGITPLMGNVPKVPASRPMGVFAASVPFEGARVHADAFGKIVSSHEEELPAPEEFDVTTAFNENAVLHVPEKAEPAPKPRAKKQRTSPFWIGHEDELHPAEEKPEEAPKDDAVVYEAGSLPYFAQSVEVVEEEPTPVAAEPVIEMTAEEIEEPVTEPAPAKKAPREHLILPGNVIDIFESAPESAPTAEPGIMAYRFDYFADHSAAKKRERELKSPFEAKPASKNTETTVPDAHIDDLLLRPAVQEEAPAPVYEQEELTITFGEEEAELLENKKMHFVPVDGIEIAVFADADASAEELRAEARRIADQINHVESPEEPAEEIAEEIVEETSAPEAVEETIEVIDEPAAAAEEKTAVLAAQPVAFTIAEPEEATEEPIVFEIEEPAEVIEEPVAVEIEEPAEVVEEPVVIEIEETVETIEEPVVVEIEETAEVVEEPDVVEIEEAVEVAEEPVVVEIEETAEVVEEPVVVEIEETAEVIEEPVVVEI